ncbi:MAG: hypothetical protein L3J71_16785 [Victivallaceae bacterium]|nr:hypothetical protein [Victivallaceae bacterium]
MKKFLKKQLAITLASTLTATAIYAGSSAGVTFKPVGPGNGGAMFGIGIKPNNPNVIIFGGDMGSMYRTANGGEKWSLIGGSSGNQPGNSCPYDIKFSVKNPNLAWVAGGGAFKSKDAGKTWQRMTPFTTTLGAVAIDPSDNNIVYIAEGAVPRLMLSWVKGRVWKTVNGGKSWQKISIGPLANPADKVTNYSALVIDPNSKVIPGKGHARVYLIGRSGFYRSEDAGHSWKILGKQFVQGQLCDLVLINQNGQSILAMTAAPVPNQKYGGVYISKDNGNSWEARNSGLAELFKGLERYNKNLLKNPKAYIFSLMIAHSPQANDRLYIGSGIGLYRSDDLGKTWHKLIGRASYVKDRYGKYVAVLKDTKVFTKSLSGGIDAFHRLVVASNNADIVAFGDNQGVYITKNGGKTWEDVTFDYGKKFTTGSLSEYGLPPNRYTHRTSTRGVQNIVCDQIAIDPFDPKIQYAAYMDLGLEISRDGGKSWEHPNTGIPSRGHAWAVAVDPSKKGRVFVTVGQKWNQPGGIYRSKDSGKSWKRVGLTDAAMGVINDIAVDLKSPVSSRIIYLSTEKKGIYKSLDGGNNWQHLTSIPAGEARKCTSIEIAPDNPKQLYVGSYAGLLISKDAGESWKVVGSKQFGRVKTISISRSNPNYIYLTANLLKNNFYWGKAHFYRSTNGGQSFTDITPKYFKYAGAIAVNPYDKNYLYACNGLMDIKGKQKMWIVRSIDGGKSWQNIGNDISFTRGVNITIDPQNPQIFFVHARFGILEGIDKNAPIK